jgi:hypothetical protein
MSKALDQTKRLMAVLGRMPPKQHKDMKLGKNKEKGSESPAPKRRLGVSTKES